MMYRILTGFIIVLGLTTTSLANDIYVTQSGNTLDLDITQDGQNNTLVIQPLLLHQQVMHST